LYAYAPATGTIYIFSNKSTLTPGDGYLVTTDASGFVWDQSTHSYAGGQPTPAGNSRGAFDFEMTTETANNVSVSASGTETIFDTSGSGNTAIYGGSIVGPDVTSVTVTWQDGDTTVLADGGASIDGSGSQYTVVPLPPLAPVQSLTFDNGDTGSALDYGYTVYRTTV